MLLQPTGNFLSFNAGSLQARIYENSGHIELAGPDLEGNALANVITLQPPSVTVAGTNLNVGRVLSSQLLGNGLQVVQALGTAQITAQLTFPHDGVMRYEVVDWGGPAPSEVRITAASDDNEHFYGFGEKFNAFDQAGNTVQMVTFDQPGDKGDKSYKVAPWFVSTRGYGFHLDSTAESTFNMRDDQADRYTVTNPFSTLAFNVVYGPRLTDVLTRFIGYTGRPPLPPPFAFGTWISSDIWRNGGEVRYAVTKFRERGIPASVFVFDSPWETAYNDFQFNMTQFGRGGTFEGENHDGFTSVAEMMEFLRTSGLKVVCWMTPFINDDSKDDEVPGQLAKAPNFDDGVNQGVFVRISQGGAPLRVNWWKGRGSHVDFTNPAAANWLTQQLRSLLAQSEVTTQSGTREPAIGGFKTDDGEALTNQNSQDTPGGVYIPTTAAYSDGRTGKEMRNGYCVEYHKTIYNVLGAQGLIFARSGFNGTQAFPGCWSGDNQPNFGDENGLPSVIVAGQSAAMSGFSIWANDVGGYLNTNFSPVSPANLLMRWTQFGCFSPIMQMHRQVDQDDLRQYPWGYPVGAENFDNNAALENYRFYARLHTQLFPYIYTYAKESSTNGLPIIRPLVLLHQDDSETYSIKHTYYFGNEFLVAPVIKPTNAGQVTQRTLYLPEGNWFDFWTQEQHAGKQNITWTNRNQQQFPLFVREGAIVPLLLNVPQTLCDANYVNSADIITMDDGLHFLIYPGGDSSFTVYDGTTVQCQTSGGARSVTLTSVPRQIMLQIFGDEPGRIQRDGVVLNKFATRPEFDVADVGWHYDTASQFSFVKFQHLGGPIQIVIEN
jgi:alpha-D-xyloside xylohydrolase